MFSAGRQVRAAAAERRAQEHHGRDARVGADQPAEPEQDVADHRRGDDRAERLGQREREPELVGGQDEERARDDHEQRDREVRPEQEARRTCRGRRRRSGTGSMPQDGVSFASSALPSPA